jgi:hypothetical protein
MFPKAFFPGSYFFGGYFAPVDDAVAAEAYPLFRGMLVNVGRMMGG